MKIAILDYGVGNVGPLVSAIKRLGYSDVDYEVVDTAVRLNNFDKFILPGVGSFDYCMGALKESGFIDSLQEAVIVHQKNILGICAGAQVMGICSEEGQLSGLGWIEMEVKKFPKTLPYPIPHLGWNEIEPQVTHPLFHKMEANKKFYFSHSYYFDVKNKQDILATTQYEMTFPSIVSSKNIYAIQFHPEKSHFQGLQMIKNFINECDNVI